MTVDLSSSEQFLLEWLSKEDWSSYGECHGNDFDRLQSCGLVERKPSHRSREHEFFDLCRITEKGWEVLHQQRSGS
jgi:hypothetical protein